MASTLKILAGLVAGLLVGLAISSWFAPSAESVTAVTDVIGGLWINALRMTVMPLIFALLTAGVVRTVVTASGSGIAGRTAAIFGGFYLASGVIGAALSLAFLKLMPIPEAARPALSGGSLEHVPQLAGPGEMILGIVPSNVFQSAANDALLPVVVFAIVLGAALARLDEEDRAPLANVLNSLVKAMLTIIHWIIALAPIGVFALMVSVAADTGLMAIGGLAHYVFFVSTIAAALLLLAYPVAAILGRKRLGDFARAMLPAQAVAMSTRSSLASLPAMLESAELLDLPIPTASITLPLAASIFRFGSPANNVAVVLYGAAIYGVSTPWWLVGGAVLVAIMTELGMAGLPNQATFFATYMPVAAVLGVPIEFLAILIAVDVIPDTLTTICNVSMDVATTSAIARGAGGLDADAITADDAVRG